MVLSGLLAILGLLPFLFGELMNGYMEAYADRLFPFPVIALLFLVLWCAISFLAFGRLGGVKQVVVPLNAAALAVLALLGVQELLLGRYWPDAIGIWTQLFYLPLLNLAFTLTPWGHTVFSAHCAAFLLMVAASFAGCIVRRRWTRGAHYN